MEGQQRRGEHVDQGEFSRGFVCGQELPVYFKSLLLVNCTPLS